MSDTISNVDLALCKVMKSRTGLRRRDLSPRTIARFHAKYAKTEGCWQWTAGRYPAGYGMQNLGRDFTGRQHTDYAHRVAFVLAHGDIPAGPFSVLHACDNPGCVNPAHLSLGTQRDNLRDASVKGRLPKQRKAA